MKNPYVKNPVDKVVLKIIPIVLNICSFSGSSTRFRQGEGLKA